MKLCLIFYGSIFRETKSVIFAVFKQIFMVENTSRSFRFEMLTKLLAYSRVRVLNQPQFPMPVIRGMSLLDSKGLIPDDPKLSEKEESRSFVRLKIFIVVHIYPD